jgi:uncharacterized protein (TIGR03435 family)
VKAAALALLLSAASLGAEAPRQFDVASVKAFKPGSAPEAARRITAAHGAVTLTQQTLRECLQWAYDLKDSSHIAGPDWIDVEQFDITGKASPEISDDQLRLMLQSLLVERFKLAAHRRTEERSVYALTVGKDGPKMRKVDREPVRGFHIGTDNGVLVYEFVADVPRLVSLLPAFLDHPVVDRTALAGVYEMKLRVELNEHAQLPQVGMVFNGFGYTPSVFAAVQELGLKLSPAKGPIEVLVIDHIERPAAN